MSNVVEAIFEPYDHWWARCGTEVKKKKKTLGNVCLHNWALHQAIQ